MNEWTNKQMNQWTDNQQLFRMQELCRQARTKDSHVGVLYGEVTVEAMEGGCVGKAWGERESWGLSAFRKQEREGRPVEEAEENWEREVRMMQRPNEKGVEFPE